MRRYTFCQPRRMSKSVIFFCVLETRLIRAWKARALAQPGLPSFACKPDLFPYLMAAVERRDLTRWVEGQVGRQKGYLTELLAHIVSPHQVCVKRKSFARPYLLY